MTINQRIREFRKQEGLNQTEFGERIKLKHGAVSKLEQDGNTVTDQNVHMICETFGVAERWLRTGEGEMRVNDDRLYIRKLAQQYQLPGLHADVIEAWLSLSDSQRDALLGLMRELAERTAAASAAREADHIGVPANMATVEDSSTVSPITEQSSAVRPQDVDIEKEVAAYRAELEAQQRGQSPSAGTADKRA